MTGGSPTQRKSGLAASLDSLTLLTQSTSTIPRISHNTSDGTADIAAHPGVSTAGGSGGQPSGIPNVGAFNAAASRQSAIPDPVLGHPGQFDDAPYLPPRVTQAELQTYPALDPRICNVYPPNHDIQHQYPYEGGTSPSESHHSAESNWSTPSSSSTSSQQLPHDYLIESASQYPQTPQPHRHTTYPQHYPAYQGQHRLGLESVRYGEHPSNTGGSYYRTLPQGYLTDGLLSPEIFDDATARIAIPSQVNYPATSSHESSSPSISATNQVPNVSAFSVSPTPLDSGRSIFPDAGPSLRQQLGLSAHEPVDLHSLPDPPPGEKPSTPLPMLIKLAIYGSANKQLTLQEIYTEIENRFQWYRDHKHEKAWKNSIRHNLSLNKVFRHVPRPITEPGKGSYWQLDMSGGEGYKRLRKRRPKNKMIASEEEDEEASEMDEDRPSPLDSSQHTGLTRSSATPIEDCYIDPELRSEGHVVGEGRTRSTTRRAGGGSPYPSQSPRYQQGSLPVVAGQDTSAPAQPPVRFDQPSFGQSSFPTYPQSRPMPVASSSLSFAAMSSPSMTIAPTASMVTRPQLQHVAAYDRTVSIPHPPPRPGIEYVDSAGLPAARRVKTYPESQGQSQGNAAHSPSESSSSGSSQTWNDARSRSQMDDRDDTS